MKNTHSQFVLNHLIDHGYITDSIAQTYRIRRLAARIFDLTQGGKAVVQRETRRDELGQKYTYYYMTPSERYLQMQMRTQRVQYPEQVLNAA